MHPPCVCPRQSPWSCWAGVLSQPQASPPHPGTRLSTPDSSHCQSSIAPPGPPSDPDHAVAVCRQKSMSHSPDASMEGCVGFIYIHLARSILKTNVRAFTVCWSSEWQPWLESHSEEQFCGMNPSVLKVSTVQFVQQGQSWSDFLPLQFLLEQDIGADTCTLEVWSVSFMEIIHTTIF